MKLAQQTIAQVMCLDEFVDNLTNIRASGNNAVSIRDSLGTRGRNQVKYDMIDSAGLENLYVVEFDDLGYEFENRKGLIFPQESHIIGILDWAKQKWEENQKPFVVHCTGGVSRSSAVAMLINQMIINDYRAGWNMELHSPNNKVLDFGAKHLGIDPFSETVKKETKEFDKQRWEF